MKQKFILSDDHIDIEKKVGILLINLGTPESYSYFSVRKYLKEFLSDPRVIEANKILWWCILNLIVLNLRTHKTASKYKQIWMHNKGMQEKGMSPLKYYTEALTKKLSAKINPKNKKNIYIDYAMRYGQPSISQKLNHLIDSGYRNIICLPLYPQYSSTTTASVTDEVYRVIKNIRWQPQIKILNPYHDNQLYIDALVKSIKSHCSKVDWKPDAILSSYHGIPQQYFDKGDPYYCFCNKTNRLFSTALVNYKIDIPNHMSFQSRFGPTKWLRPYTHDTIVKLAKSGVKNLFVISPGFSCDCIETLEEINIEYRNLFLSNGGKNFTLVPCLNDSNDAVDLVYKLIYTNPVDICKEV